MTDRRRRIPAAIVAVVAAIAAIIELVGLVVDARQVAVAFLVAYAAVTSVMLGVLAMTMIALLTTASWFAAVRHYAERVISALPALAVLCVPLLVAVLTLQPAVAPDDHARRAYLNPTFLVARAVLYWIAWLVIAESLRVAFRIQRGGDDAKAARRFRVISCAGLVVLSLTMTFASFDWMMALTPRWYSTVYGVYWFAGGMTGAMGLLAILGRAYGKPAELTGSFQAIGKLMLTFVMFWVYTGFAQYIVIWSGNIPVEVLWYVQRTRGAWGGVALALLIGAAIAFVALVNRSIRARGEVVAALGVLVLVLHYVDTSWMLLPSVMPATWWVAALSVATLIIVAESAILVAATRQRSLTPDDVAIY
ncbi:MAG: hypothetical protein ACREPM_12535 [Gemmatimonadaceae bacterium]